MWAAFWDALAEAGGRKIVIAIVLLSLGIGYLYSRAVDFGKLANVNVLFFGPQNMGPYPFAVPQLLGTLTPLANVIATMLMIFAGCPQFVAMLEKGWRELTFSKGTARWQILLSRFISLTILYIAMYMGVCLPLALKLWWGTGIHPFSLLGSAVIATFSFAAMLSVGALASMTGTGGVAIPIGAPMMMFVVSQYLVERQRILWGYITSEFWRGVIDWLYYIFPKIQELQGAGAAYVQSATLPTSWPVWTTGLFTLVTLATTLWILERKSF